jgi:hypothetical protein
MASGVDPGDKAQKDSDANNLPGIFGTIINRSDDCLLQHA